MLQDQGATRGSDYWALGCMVFQLLAGYPPFTAPTVYMIFEKIKAGKFTFPEGFPSTAQSLVLGLLNPDPKARLGYNGALEIKTHPFFDGVDWEGIHTQTAPVWAPHPPTQAALAKKAAVVAQQSRQKLLEEQLATVPVAKALNGSELIVHMSLIWKTKGLSKKKRMLIMTDLPRILYLDPVDRDVKGEIPWNDSGEKLRVEVKDSRKFEIHTPDRSYHMEDITLGARKWQEEIIAQQKRLTSPGASSTASTLSV